MEAAANGSGGSAGPADRAGRFSVTSLRGAAWALRALREARSGISRSGISPMIELDQPTALPDRAERGVQAVLHRRHANCLERAIVLQAWLASRGERRDLVIGVTAPDDDFRAHAWLEGQPQCHDGEFSQLARRPAPTPRA